MNLSYCLAENSLRMFYSCQIVAVHACPSSFVLVQTPIIPASGLH